MNELLENVLTKLEKSEAERERERNTYLNKLKSQTMGYQKALEQQSKMYMQTLQSQEKQWKQTLLNMQSELMDRLNSQTQRAGALQSEYEGYLMDLTTTLKGLKNQLEELYMK